MGIPTISAKGFPGKRVDAMRAGMMPIIFMMCDLGKNAHASEIATTQKLKAQKAKLKTTAQNRKTFDFSVVVLTFAI